MPRRRRDRSAPPAPQARRARASLRIAAARLAATDDGSIAALVRELASDQPLDALAVPGDSRSVRAVFAGAYRSLGAPAAAAFRLIGLHPGGGPVHRDAVRAAAGDGAAGASGTIWEPMAIQAKFPLPSLMTVETVLLPKLATMMSRSLSLSRSTGSTSTGSSPAAMLPRSPQWWRALQMASPRVAASCLG